MKRVLLKILLGIDALVFIVLSILSQCIISIDTVTGEVCDGFGRVLMPAPLLIGTEEWVGLKWYVIDIAVAILLIGIAYILYQTITKTPRNANKE